MPTYRPLIHLLVGASLLLSLFPAAAANAQALPLKIESMRALLFFGDTGTFSPDVAETNDGQPFVPSMLWNAPMKHENRSTSVLVIVEVSGYPGRQQLEFVARYIPWNKESGAVTVRKLMPIDISLEVGMSSGKHYAGFWLDQTGCHPVQLLARVIGPKETAREKKVIKFGCGE